MPFNEPVIVGRFGAPYGIKGWLRVTSFTDPADNIRNYRPWLVDFGAGLGEITLINFRALSKGFAVHVEGVADREAAIDWRGREISVAADQLPEVAADEIYWKDLIGLAASTPDGTPIGRVSQLLPAGSHDVLVIDREACEVPIMVPFHREYVRQVDLDQGKLVADVSGFED
ncbi:MAG: ribosome maturation factor RimM [Gammaproteobacteria bacterium]|nr:ribosome maturation factor RimM [Gammaproteobacteria bacterium]MCY4276833.1 ribosome maturation factor RimM [Gammaproteobacteria bacterium]MCY4324259.1 ribosome maturation factor RimM [Gammaproteobacteria bacterium]